jgi:hypothetical protein
VVSIKNIFDFPLAQENDKPIWIKPYSVSNTPMTKAFENALAWRHARDLMQIVNIVCVTFVGTFS